jgi:phage FluMu protein Com
MKKKEKEFRCPGCNKLLFTGELQQGRIEIVCPRCCLEVRLVPKNSRRTAEVKEDLVSPG